MTAVHLKNNLPQNVASALERVKGIEPSYSAWKAAALPLSYTRSAPTQRALLVVDQLKSLALYLTTPKNLLPGFQNRTGGGGWIRTNVSKANGFTARPL